MRSLVISAMRGIVGVSFLSYYLLPDTPLGRATLQELATPYIRSLPPDIVIGGTAIVVSLLLLHLYRAFATGKEAPSRWLMLLTSVYMLPMITSLLLSKSAPLLAADMAGLLLALATGIAAVLLLGSAERGVVALVLLATVQCLYAIYFQKMGTHATTSGDVLRAQGTFPSADDLYTLTLLTLPISVFIVLREKRPVTRLLYCLATSIILAAQISTWNRGGACGIAVGLGYLVLRLSGRRSVRVIAAAILAGLVLLTFQRRTAGPINAASAARSADGRLLLWQQGFIRFERHWLTGVGVGCLEIPLVTPTRDPDVMRVRSYREPKNILLHWMAEMGVAGLLMFFGFIAAISRSLRAARDRALAAAIAAAWLALVVAGVVDTPFGVANRLVGTTLVGALLGTTLLAAARAPGRPGRSGDGAMIDPSGPVDSVPLGSESADAYVNHPVPVQGGAHVGGI